MSRCDESGEHEGWIAQRFGDGLESSSTTGAGVLVWPTGRPADGEEIRPYADVVSWHVRCSCGWSGGIFPLDAERPDDVDARWADPTEARENALMAIWERHVRPYGAVNELGRLADEARELDARIRDAVTAARTFGASWADIGGALGMSKQGAQQRFGGQFSPSWISRGSAARSSSSGEGSSSH